MTTHTYDHHYFHSDVHQWSVLNMAISLNIYILVIKTMCSSHSHHQFYKRGLPLQYYTPPQVWYDGDHQYYRVAMMMTMMTGLHNLLQPGSRDERKWRENEKMKRKWRENEEVERNLSRFPYFLFISSLSIHFLYQNCNILSQNVKRGLLSRMSQKA